MKVFIACFLLFVCTGFYAYAGEMIIKTGQNIDDVTKIMTSEGYKEAGLEMETLAKDHVALKMWSVGEGSLIFEYSTNNKKIKNISYYFCDERPKLTRKTFEFTITEFDPNSKEMKIKLPNKSLEKTTGKH
jgi:hypothetical protein